MSVVRHYKMVALNGRESEFASALRDLADRIAQLPLSCGVEVLRDFQAEDTFIFIERWNSVEDQTAAGAILGRAAFSAIAPTLAAPPESRYLVPLAA